jgi:hypothetical protein
LKFRRIYSISKDTESGIKSDQIGVLTNRSASKRYPEKVRRISYYNAEQDRDFIFLTNDFTSSSSVIAELYRKRWSIELFFKWIKQHLKIKTFWGTTANAVKIQVNCAIIAYCLVAIVAKKTKTEHTIYEILQILGKSLLDKTPIKQLLTNYDYKYFKKLNYNSLFNN